MCAVFHRLSRSGTDASEPDSDLNCEMDSHADTVAAGRNFVLYDTPSRTVNVHAYSEEYKPITDIPIATVATVWIDESNGQPYLLIFHEALFFGARLSHSLICPNQLRAQGLTVHDTPQQFDPTSTHSIQVHDPPTIIPLHLKGVVSCFPTIKPTDDDLENLPRIIMTSSATWNPCSSSFAKTEEKYRNLSSATQCIRNESRDENSNEPRVMSAARTFISSLGDTMVLDNDDGDDDLYHRLIAKVRVTVDNSEEDPEGTSWIPTGNMFGSYAHWGDKPPPKPLDPNADAERSASALTSNGSKPVLTPETLARRWKISLDKAKKTLLVTTQAGVRNVLVPSERKVRKKAPWLKFPSIKGKWYTDQYFSKVPSIHGKIGASIFTNGYGFDVVYPWKSKALHHEALTSFIHDVGVPQTLVSDGASELIHGKTKEICNEYRISQRVTVPYSPWQNLAEASIRESKKETRRVIRETGAPRRVWSYAAKWRADVRRFTSSEIGDLDGRSPFEYVIGSTPDISSLAMFDFYEVVYYLMPVTEYPFEKKLIGRWLGLADNCTDDMAYVILTESGSTIIRKSVWGIPEDERKTTVFQDRLQKVNDAINARLADKSRENEEFPLPPTYLFEGDEEDDIIEPVAPELEPPDADDYTPEELDEYLTAQVMLPHGGETARATVLGRTKNASGQPVGTRHSNPILDTRSYEVQFPDGSIDTFTTNMIAENLFSQVDEEGHSYVVLKDIVGHRSNKRAVRKDDPLYLEGKKMQTTVGWDLECLWADGSTSWVPLKGLKESNTVEVAEYALTAGISEEPAFKWWVMYTLRKRDRIIKKVKSRYWTRTHKYGVEMPKSVKDAFEIDRRTGTDFWKKAIEKEMKNVDCAFQFRDDDVVPPGYKKINCHMVFDIKSDLTRKARFVAGGHMTDPPKESTYSSVVSRDSVRIAFTMAALNGLDVMSADVQNAYLNAPTKEKCYTIAGLEFGSVNAGRPVMIVRALYGLKSSGARWRDHMAATLRDGGYKGCQADPDVWMKPNTRPDGFKYWEYVLCYVDDILVVSHEPQKVMDYLSTRYTLKAGSVKPPTEYLGAQILQYQVPTSDGGSKIVWGMTADLYTKRAIADVEKELAALDQKLKMKVTTPLSQGYRPELDATPELDSRRGNYFQGLIGVLRWIVEQGRIDINVPVALLSRYLTNPREGHLEQALHIFAYLKRYDRSTLVFDATPINLPSDRFPKADWTGFYPDAAEVIPPNMPEARGNFVSTTCFVDADHAGCQVTRRSHTGVLIFVQKAPIIWYSKRQNTVEASTFGSEFIAMKTAVDLIEGLRYKLRMMGIPIDEATSVICDNESVFKNSTVPESTLKKKHNAIAYHRAREAQAAGIVRIAWEPGETNLADILTKLLPGPRLRFIVQRILW